MNMEGPRDVAALSFCRMPHFLSQDIQALAVVWRKCATSAISAAGGESLNSFVLFP
jgi:hypothetical protein